MRIVGVAMKEDLAVDIRIDMHGRVLVVDLDSSWGGGERAGLGSRFEVGVRPMLRSVVLR